MPRLGELRYFSDLSEEGLQHALDKPFSDPKCGLMLMEIGALFELLPKPPARVLECGCGTGWLTGMLQQRGYETVGIDVAADAIDLARAQFPEDDSPTFEVHDVESLPFENEFDAVVFFEALHHSIDEKEALRSAWRALKPGGVCVTSEPGVGHHRKSQEVIEKWDVTEKDMPPKHIVRLGKEVGFSSYEIYPRADDVGRLIYDWNWPTSRMVRSVLSVWPLRYLTAFWLMMFHKRNKGITLLRK